MTSRQRMHRALTEGRDHDFPVVIPYVSLFARDHWEELTKLPFWVRQYGTDEQHLTWMRDLLDAVLMDWLPVPFGSSTRWHETHEVIQRSGRWWLCDLKHQTETPLVREPPGGQQAVQSRRRILVREVDDIEGAVPCASTEGLEQSGCYDLPRLARETFPDQCLATAVGAPFWRCHAYLGFEGLMTAVTERPELLIALLERLTENAVEQVRGFAAAGVYDVVWLEDCYSSADLISLPHFRRFVAPYVKQVIDAIHAGGMASVYYFCGNVDDRLEDLVELGPTAIGLEESKKDFEIGIADVVDRVAGRCCVFGNLNAVHALRRGAPDEVRDALREQLAAARKARRFVVSLGSPVTPDTPVGRVRQYVQWARELSRAPVL